VGPVESVREGGQVLADGEVSDRPHYVCANRISSALHICGM
jgi:hypothetical protein